MDASNGTYQHNLVRCSESLEYKKARFYIMLETEGLILSIIPIYWRYVFDKCYYDINIKSIKYRYYIEINSHYYIFSKVN